MIIVDGLRLLSVQQALISTLMFHQSFFVSCQTTQSTTSRILRRVLGINQFQYFPLVQHLQLAHPLWQIFL